MDLLWLNILSIAAQAALHLALIGRLAGSRFRPLHLAAYLALLWAVGRTEAVLAVGAELLALYLLGRAAWRLRPGGAGTAAVLAVSVTQLSFGVTASLESLVLPGLLGRPLLYLVPFLGTLASLALAAGCSLAVGRLLSLREEGAGSLLLPGLFLLAVELILLGAAYQTAPSPLPAGSHLALLVLQLLGLGALLSTLYVYRRVRQGLQAQAELTALAQTAAAQRTYVAEAQARYERSRAFRHDIRNHLTVLSGLLRSGRTEEAECYLRKLDASVGSLSLPYRTGLPVVDILLGEKLAGIPAEVHVSLPVPCRIDELDLCAIFANALDNALAAADLPRLRISGHAQGDLLLLEFENDCAPGPLPPMGTGLASIRAAAEKYRGAMTAEKAGYRFRLSVLLNIS